MPLQIGRIRVDTPLVLAPMAGVTNPPFRALCLAWARRALTDVMAEAGAVPAVGDSCHAPAGLFVSEMVTSRALVEGNPRALVMLNHDPSQTTRSIQLYGVDPATMAAAARIAADHADHIDMNFGCPVPKVMRKGGGAALPWKRDHLRRILDAVVTAAGDIPVTAKMRVGIDAAHHTYLEAALDAQEAGVAAVALHARTAAQHYSGQAQWEHIAQLRAEVAIPVLGNGDIFAGDDAVRMIAQTGCDGVVVGRGCQGRPWLFADLVYALHGVDKRVKPDLGTVCDTIIEHAQGLIGYFGDEFKGLRDLRKHIGWYLKGFPVGGDYRSRLARVESLAQLRELLADFDRDLPFPEAAEGPRGRAGTVKKPHLPYGWLDSRSVDAAALKVLAAAELDTDGG